MGGEKKKPDPATGNPFSASTTVTLSEDKEPSIWYFLCLIYGISPLGLSLEHNCSIHTLRLWGGGGIDEHCNTTSAYFPLRSSSVSIHKCLLIYMTKEQAFAPHI
jgi:hypothetical protein